jgi:hypothetical protein
MLSAITQRIAPSFSALSRNMSINVQGSPFKLALIQLAVTISKKTNLKHAHDRVMEASKQGAKVVVLPVSGIYLGTFQNQAISMVNSYPPNVGMFQLSIWHKVLPRICRGYP